MSVATKENYRKFILEFIHVYRSLPALWKVSSVEYSDRNIKSKSYDILHQKYSEKYPEATMDDVKKKINTLRTNFKKELRKKCASQKSGMATDEVYESSQWYFEDMLFLSDQETPSRNCIFIKEEGGDNETLGKKGVGPSTSHQSKPKPNRKRQSDEGDQRNDLISLACKRLSEPKDDNALLGKMWAYELSKMDREQQILAKKAINEIMFEGQMGTLHRHSVHVTPNNGRFVAVTERTISPVMSDVSGQSNS